MKTLAIYDVDDTLFTANQIINIRDNEDKIIQSIDGSQYRKHMNGRAAPLPDGHYYCFGELLNGKTFYETKMPLIEPLEQLAFDVGHHKRNPNFDVILLTARGQVDHLDDYKQAFRDHGVDVDAIDIVFVGARDSTDPRFGMSSSQCKKLAFEQYCKTYDHFIIYEDDYRNLEMFYHTSLDFGNVTVELYHVNPQGEISRYRVN